MYCGVPSRVPAAVNGAAIVGTAAIDASAASHAVFDRPKSSNVAPLLFDREWSLPEPSRQRLAFEILHDDVRRAVVLADVVESAAVRMIEARNQARLAI